MEPQPIPPPVEFAEDLPADCPPKGANPDEGSYYATHSSHPPRSEDFLTAAQRGVFKTALECRRRANSVMADLRDALHLQRAYPDRHRYISQGQIQPTHGVLLHADVGLATWVPGIRPRSD